ncbi:hypothetical protein BH160DRAFT_7045 [Burkholderia sp. H160]|nr:hypothetical protein BH160DRAFT_7045 [Burkholderia sp. H160]
MPKIFPDLFGPCLIAFGDAAMLREKVGEYADIRQ